MERRSGDNSYETYFDSLFNNDAFSKIGSAAFDVRNKIK